jgi:radical SAM protein (TIGR01212 family)
MATPDPTPFYSYRRFMTETYGVPLYRVPVDLGLGCPHRGADGAGGCAFCSPDGGRARATTGLGTIEEQIRGAIAFARRRYEATQFMAYVQAFTGTFAPEAEQRALYDRILAAHSFRALSIGTRPDCLPPGTLDLLAGLRGRTEVWVELGVQTVHDRTLQRINRGHDWDASRRAILALHARGLCVAVHVILGLPGETCADFQTTADTLASLPLDGLKIHNLHVIRGTPLAEDFARKPFPVLDEREYAEALIDFLRRLPPRLPIFRINTDTPAEELVAPKWAMKKGQFLDYVLKTMTGRGVAQGDAWKR